MDPVLLLALLAVLLVAGWAVASHNRFVRQEALVEQSWRQVEDELARRQALVPALEEVVRDYAAEDAASLRLALEAARGASGPAETAAAEQELTAVLHRLPPGPWERLQEQLAETEDRIAAARRFHQSNVRALRVRREAFPSSLVARATGVEDPEDPPALP